MGIDKCGLEFLLSLKVVMLKRVEFHKRRAACCIITINGALKHTECHMQGYSHT